MATKASVPQDLGPAVLCWVRWLIFTPTHKVCTRDFRQHRCENALRDRGGLYHRGSYWSFTSTSTAAQLAAYPYSSGDRSSCQSLPRPITGHQLWASNTLCNPHQRVQPSHPCTPIRPLLWTNFPAKLVFFSFQWLNQDQEAVRYTEPQLAKEWRECPGELSVLITSDYLQFYPK